MAGARSRCLSAAFRAADGIRTGGPITQRDPIGLAGGINQHGYAGGDPVGSSDPFGLLVEFKGDDAKKLEEEYNRAKRILRARAGNGDAEAEFVLAQLDGLEKNPNRTVTISSGNTSTGALGETDPVTGNSITIDVKRTLERSSETQLQFVIVHEMGHSWRRPTVLPGVSTNDGALYFENTVRSGINWPIRTQHEGGYPKKRNAP